jgi:hypothetical protein
MPQTLYNPTVDRVSFWLYNNGMMKQKATPKKHREHFVLFCANTPFKQKRVELKTRYQRNPKHKGKDNV